MDSYKSVCVCMCVCACVCALNKTSLKTNKQKDVFWSFRFIAGC